MRCEYQIWRQDDNGNQFVVDSYPTFEAAVQSKQSLEDSGHKQFYWIVSMNQPESSEDPKESGQKSCAP